jgi:hypothetical protein
MRLRSIIPLVLASLSTMATGCKDATAPDPEVQISMAPFERQVVHATPDLCDGCSYYNRMRIFVPSGIAPVIDVTVKDVSTSSPGLKLLGNPRLTPDPDNVCNSACTTVAWEVYIEFTVAKTGETDVTMALHADPNKQSTFRVISDKNF